MGIKSFKIPIILIFAVIILYTIGIVRQNSKIKNKNSQIEITNVSYDGKILKI